MDINFNFLNKINQAITHLFTASSSHKTESHDAEKGVISLKTIAKNAPNIPSQLALIGSVPCPTLASGDNFVGREPQRQQIREIIELWCQRQGELTAVIAPSGAGLSAFLAQVMSLLTTMHNEASSTTQNISLALPILDSVSSTNTLPIKPLPKQASAPQ